MTVVEYYIILERHAVFSFVPLVMLLHYLAKCNFVNEERV